MDQLPINVINNLINRRVEKHKNRGFCIQNTLILILILLIRIFVKINILNAIMTMTIKIIYNCKDYNINNSRII